MDLTVTSKFNPEKSFSVCAYVKDDINIGSDIINVSKLIEKYPHLEAVNPAEYRYADEETTLGQDAYEYIRPLEYCQDKSQKSLLVVRVPRGWVLSGTLFPSSSLIFTCLKCNIEVVSLVEQAKSWCELELYGAYKQVDGIY